jgi:hypothetical protein
LNDGALLQTCIDVRDNGGKDERRMK